MKVIIKEKQEADETLDCVGLSLGAIFQGNIGGHVGTFLKTYNSIVSLEDPRLVWDNWPTVKNYRKVKSATLEITI